MAQRWNRIHELRRAQTRYSDYCLGVWKKTGASSYKAHHEVRSYDDSGTPNGTVIIRKEIAVDLEGDTFSGTFTIDVLDPASNQVLHVAGQVTGTRINCGLNLVPWAIRVR